MQLGIPLSSFYKLLFFTTTHRPKRTVGKKAPKKVTIGPVSVKEFGENKTPFRSLNQTTSLRSGRQFPKSVIFCPESPITDKERDLFETFLILKEEDQLELASLLRSKCNPKTKLFFVESVIKKKYPWIQHHIEIFWDYAKLHKYVYNKNNKCENIFGKKSNGVEALTSENIYSIISKEREIYRQLEGF